jgi:hypothetical protein
MRKSRNVFPLLPFVLSLIWESYRLIKVAVVRALAPLRKITSRALKVYEYQRFGPSRHPRLFAVLDTLECGHVHTGYEWSFRDLLFAYADPVDFPHVTARRHRCHECRDLAAAKKPVRSVQIAAKAVSA